MHKKRKLAVAVTINNDSLKPNPELSNVIRSENWQAGQSIVTIPIWAAKAKAIPKLSEVIEMRYEIYIY